MSSEENKEIALSLLEALNARDLSLWSRHLAEDYIAEHPGVSIPLDKTRSMGYQQRFVTALPNIHLEVLHVLSEGDHVLIHWMASGTHSERLATVTGETIPPTRRRVSGILGREPPAQTLECPRGFALDCSQGHAGPQGGCPRSAWRSSKLSAHEGRVAFGHVPTLHPALFTRVTGSRSRTSEDVPTVAYDSLS
jgi:ketosteroid isomerase-like protein